MEVLSTKNAVMEAYERGGDPRFLLCELLQKDACEAELFSGLSPSDLWSLAFQLALSADAERGRVCRPPVSDLSEVFQLIDSASRIVVLIGAGASSGPDFRSRGGLYDQIRAAGVLDDPTDVFDMDTFREDPSIFWRFAHLIFPSECPVHSATHYFVEELERRGKLLRLYTQNVDTLERGIPDERLRCVHGSWRQSECLSCGKRYGIEDLRPAVAAGVVPHCVACGGLIKPGIVFFGQPTYWDDREICQDACAADLLLVIGTSLRVRPISELPDLMARVPAVLINWEPVDGEFNARLLGSCDDVVDAVQGALGWVEVPEREVRFVEPCTFVFENADRKGTFVYETGRSLFLGTPARADLYDFD